MSNRDTCLMRLFLFGKSSAASLYTSVGWVCAKARPLGLKLWPGRARGSGIAENSINLCDWYLERFDGKNCKKQDTGGKCDVTFLLPHHPVLITPPPDSFDSVPRLFPNQLLDLSPSSSESPVMHQLSSSSTCWSDYPSVKPTSFFLKIRPFILEHLWVTSHNISFTYSRISRIK